MSRFFKKDVSKFNSMLISSKKFVKQQAEMIRINYPFFKVEIIGNKLVCEGFTQPDGKLDIYHFKINYEPFFSDPKVTIISHDITPDKKYHMYPNGTLCLYHPKMQKWIVSNNLFDTIIPWTIHWVLFYEIYQRNGGKWLGPEAAH